MLLCTTLTLLHAPAILYAQQESHAPPAAAAKAFLLRGDIKTANRSVVAGVMLTVDGQKVTADKAGHFEARVAPGIRRISISDERYATFILDLDMESDRDLDVQLQSTNTVTVRARQDALEPDPAAKAYTREDLLEANPGRPGIPLSIPGLPVETASGGIKAPQYFSPGVAGDHGEPIAQYFQIGGFLFQNNLTANAHGNGYADPNIVVPQTIGGVLLDNAAFNARYGDHAINLAVTYVLRSRLTPFVSATTDGLDGDLAAGWSPSDPGKQEWFALEGSWGNGFLARPEERQQYKLAAYRSWTLGSHQVTALGLAYYGFSRLPGLIPIDTPVQDDTINRLQADLTHTTLALLTDAWTIREQDTLQTSAYFRTYNLDLKSDFGLGLIEQSEFRTVAGANETYTHTFNPRWALLAGLDLRRDAPRNLDLKHLNADGQFNLVTANDLTVTDIGPFAAINGMVNRDLQMYAGIRHDQIGFNNTDRITPANSFNQWPGTTSPKVNVTLGRPDAAFLPQVAFSFGKAFHANDPRIGTGTGQGSLIIQSREYQMVASKLIGGTALSVTLAHQTNSAELAKIDPDTGLQQDVGPSINRYITLAASHRYPFGFFQASWSEADARDRELGTPIPEAPRMIVDAIGTVDRLPYGLEGKSEYEYVKAKPLGDGFTGLPLQEIRLNVQKTFADGRWVASLNGELASGYTGQTTETFALQAEPRPFERIVGVPLRSYGSVSLTYLFGPR
ncbi:MAG: hypothetical protein ACR2JE_16425 [Acidobacteriaceae bacterium]